MSFAELMYDVDQAMGIINEVGLIHYVTLKEYILKCFKEGGGVDMPSFVNKPKAHRKMAGDERFLQ